jgi:hypothetical protein
MSLSAIGRSRKANLLELKTHYSPPVNFASRVVVASLYSLPPPFLAGEPGIPVHLEISPHSTSDGQSRNCS